MFRVKICGVTRPEDARMAAQSGADAIGLNFYGGSPRCVTLERAAEIAAALPPHVCKVGVFVGATAEEIKDKARTVPLDLVQLSGDEPPEFLREVRPLPVLRAARIRDDLSPVTAYLDACYRQYALPRMLLVDALRDDAYGGTGVTLDWDYLAQHRRALNGLPLVLAGGLTPDNVAAAIARVRPWAVDVASGVEQAPGAKSPELVSRFVSAARAALDRLMEAT